MKPNLWPAQQPRECAAHLLRHAREADYIHEEDGDVDVTPRQRSHLRDQAVVGKGAGRMKSGLRGLR